MGHRGEPAEPVRRLDGPWAIGAGAVVALVAVIFLRGTLGANVADPDAFYHLGHAMAYLEGSVFDTAFPWARFSVIGALGGDLWWGFHMLLLPFAAATPVPGSIGVAGIVLTATLAGGVLWLAVRHRFVWPWIWPLLFLVAVPNVLYRLLMVRPHVISLLTALLLLSALARRRWWAAGAAAGLLVWVHASLFWMPLAILGVFAVAVAWDRRGGEPQAWLLLKPALSAVVPGVAAGLLLRPHPLATLRLVDVQIFQLLRERSEVPLSIGGELIPFPPEALFTSSWILLIPWAVALAVGVWSLFGGGRYREMAEEDRLLLACAAMLSVAFLGVALAVAARAIVEWAAFGLLTVAVAWTRLLPSRGWSAWATGMTGLVTLLAVPWILGWHATNVRLNSLPADHLREAAEFLEAESREGDLVFHAHWDNFGSLFAWNRTNRYLGGMDPIFQLTYDRELYWKHAHLASGDMVATTCGAARCGEGEGEDTHAVLAGDFGARWVLVEPFRNRELYLYMRGDPRFDLRRLTRAEAVFEILEEEVP